ncbi:MAG TPA: septal ring lytic transglycosylase RlpA family protein [Desulfobacterales bacterium]|nr:septal ring lytic transglycosylase RlpA family protein [Desulfobacterales bacterium]
MTGYRFAACCLLFVWLSALGGCVKYRIPLPSLPPLGRPAKQPPAGKRVPATQRPYRIKGKTYYPLPTAEGYRTVGRASWYGRPFHGRRTASGEVYNMYDLTAAHRTLPMNTYLLVRNLENGREVVVRVNDRGPFVKGREIDLSYGAAKRLGMVKKGVARVELVALGEAVTVRRNGRVEPRFLPHPDLRRGDFYVQVGSFADRANAERLKRRLLAEGRKTVVLAVQQAGRRFYRVQVRGGRTLAAARRMARRMEQAGFPGAFVVAH